MLVNGGRWEAHLGQQIKLVPDSMPWRTGVRRGELRQPLCGRPFLTVSIKELLAPVSDAGDLKNTSFGSLQWRERLVSDSQVELCARDGVLGLSPLAGLHESYVFFLQMCK